MEKHDVNLSKRRLRLRGNLATLANEKDLQHFLVTIHHPGFTTPAEFLSFRGVLDAMLPVMVANVTAWPRRSDGDLGAGNWNDYIYNESPCLTLPSADTILWPAVPLSESPSVPRICSSASRAALAAVTFLSVR